MKMQANFALILTLAPAFTLAFPWLISVNEKSDQQTHHASKVFQYPLTVYSNQADLGERCNLQSRRPSGAAPYNHKFPYVGAVHGKPGTGVGLVRVPAKGDDAHAFRAPGPGDERGPCPGLNTAANHNFISHNGITTHDEIVTGLQNLYNVGYDFASFAATLGISQVGNITTEELSIGTCGLSTHGAIEGDTSLTRDDLALSPLDPADSHSFNSSLFRHMAHECNDVFDQRSLAKYRALRYEESRATNPHFFFGPKCLLIFGASSFLYELMPSYADSRSRGFPSLENIASFFGAKPSCTSSSGWQHVPEQIPKDWMNRPTPYTLRDFATNALHTYLAYPKEMGENMGSVDVWRTVADFGVVKNGYIPAGTTDGEAFCHLWKVVVEGVPGLGGEFVPFTPEVQKWITMKMEPLFEGAGCW